MKSRVLGALAVLANAACGWAAEPVKLSDLIQTALANNPEILAAESRYKAARQRPAQQSSLPDPIVSPGYASNGGPLPGQGLGVQPTSNIGFTISQELPFPGKRRLRGAIAAKDADAEFQEYQALQLSVRARVESAFHRLHHAYAAISILAEGKELLTQAIRISEVRYAAGKAAQQDVLKAQTQLSILEARALEKQQDLETAEAELNALLNRKPQAPLGVPEDLEPAPLTFTLEQLLEKAAVASPELLRGEEVIAGNALAVDLAREEFHSDYTVSAGYYFMGSMPPMYQLRVDIPVHLHTQTKQRSALEERVQRLSEAKHALDATQATLQYRIREAYLAAQTAERLQKLYADTILPQSSLTIESSLASYQTGAADFLSVLSNVMTKVDAEERFHEQEMMYELALARLEELTGVTFGADGENTK